MTTERISAIAEQLRQAIIEETSDITVGATIFINSQGCNFEFSERTKQSLENEGISMRNLKGKFI